jgi:hypothetical protein
MSRRVNVAIHCESGNVCVIEKGKIRIENVYDYVFEKKIY